METPHKFAVIHLRGVFTNKKYYMFYRHAIIQITNYCILYVIIIFKLLLFVNYF